jgi:hypothetical protein
MDLDQRLDSIQTNEKLILYIHKYVLDFQEAVDIATEVSGIKSCSINQKLAGK